MKNYEIYKIYEKIKENVNLFSDNYMPAKIAFFISKNLKAINNAVEEIYEVRKNIIMHYGVYDEEKHDVFVPNDKLAQVNQEIDELMNIEQDIDIHYISIKDLEKLDFTHQQMEAIFFMLKE